MSTYWIIATYFAHKTIIKKCTNHHFPQDGGGTKSNKTLPVYLNKIIKIKIRKKDMVALTDYIVSNIFVN